MYNHDQPRIAEYIAEDWRHFVYAAMFCVLSANQRLSHVPRMLEAVRHEGLDAPILRASRVKRRAYEVLMAEGSALHFDLLLGHTMTTHDIIRTLTDVPGLGITKAGFLVQLALGTAGCLDRHHLRRIGLHPRAFQGAVTDQKIARYLALCNELGGSACLWDDWCELLSQLYPVHFPSADAASRFHVTTILGHEATVVKEAA